MNEINMDQLLIQMRAMADKANNINEAAAAKGDKPDFTNMFKDAVNKVNESQKLIPKFLGLMENTVFTFKTSLKHSSQTVTIQKCLKWFYKSFSPIKQLLAA